MDFQLQRWIHSCIWLLGVVMMLLCNITIESSIDILSLYSYTPRAGPIQGGTVLSVTGAGFLSSTTKCQLEHSSYGSQVVDNSLVTNSTHMVCILPPIEFLPDLSMIIEGFNVSLVVINTPERSEQAYNFLVYNQNVVGLSWLDPSWDYNNTDTDIGIFGIGFVNTGEITCDIGDKVSIPATFINSTLLMCQLPPYPVTAQVVVNVQMNGQPVSLVQMLMEGAANFTYYSTPPAPLKCSFNPSYAFLVLEFDRQIELGGESYSYSGIPQDDPDCEMIFTNNTFDLLGSGSSCSWKNTLQDTIIIELSVYSLVVPNLVLFLRSGTLRTRHTTYSKHASGSIKVKQNSAILQPVAVVTGPQYIPYCGNFTFSGKTSQNSGATTLLYKWSISENRLTESTSGSGSDPDNGIVPLLEPVENLFTNNFTNQLTITLSSESFITDVAYTVTMTVQNFLGLKDEHSLTLVKLPSPAPLVSLSGGDSQELFANRDFHIQAAVDLPGCNDAEQIHFTYIWTIFFSGDVITIPGVVTNSSAFLIPSNSLLPNASYKVTLVVGDNSQSGNASTVLHTLANKIQARIFGGNSITYSQGEAIILDGSCSGEINNLHAELVVIWKCTSAEGEKETACIDSMSGNTLSISENLTHELPPGTLSPGMYRITLILAVVELNMSSTAVQVLHLLNYSAPQVFLQWPPEAGGYPVHQKLIIDAMVSWHSNGVIKWECVYETGYAYLPLDTSLTPVVLDIVSADNLSLFTRAEMTAFTKGMPTIKDTTDGDYNNLISLVLPPYSLLPGNLYRFRLTATGKDGQQGDAVVDIATESVPSSGSLLVQPNVGMPIHTSFSLQAQSWTDDVGDLPLKYRFGFLPHSTGNDIVWLSGITPEYKLTTRLPLLSNTQNINLVLQVFDMNGAAVLHFQSLSLTAQSNQNVNLNEVYDSIYSDSIIQGQWMNGLASAMSVLHALNRAGKVFVTDLSGIQDFKRLVTTMTIDILNYHIPRDKSIYLLITNLLKEATMEVQYSTVEVLSLVHALDNIVHAFAYNKYWVASTITRGLTESEAESVLRAYSNLIKHHSQLSLNVTVGRIRENDITRSYHANLPAFSHSLCQQLGSYEGSAQLSDPVLGHLKVSRIPPLNNQSVADTNDSTIPRSFVNFGQTIFTHFLQLLIAPNTCKTSSGMCVAMVQSVNDIHWQGSPYEHHIISATVSLHLLSSNSGDIISFDSLEDPVELTLPLLQDPSLSGTLECATWDEASSEWSAEGCSTTAILPAAVQCSCHHLSDFAILDRCPSGFFGPACIEVCPQGLWGDSCRETCDCSNRGTCSAHDGSCDCQQGWTGNRCQHACDDGMWGKHCKEVCLCENGGECHHVDGSCNCPPGWNGTICNNSCSDGYYGQDCTSLCQCRDATECNGATGKCLCLPGYAGPTCHSACPDDYYGNNCSLACQCHKQGTDTCDHVTGMCSCLLGWEGPLCDKVIPSPTPVPVAVFQIWWAIVPVVLILLIVTPTTIIVTICCVKMKKKKTLKVAPNAVKDDTEGIDGIEEGEDSSLSMTSAKSLTVQVPKGKNLTELFHKVSGEFVEPEQMDGKMRWKIIQLIPESTKPSTAMRPSSRPVGSKQELPLQQQSIEMELLEVKSHCSSSNDGRTSQSQKHRSESLEDESVELEYRKGLYMNDEATLKDLRNDFIESSQAEQENRFFQFLRSNMLGDYIPIDAEEETKLLDLQSLLVQPRTLYVERLEDGDNRIELCICGKFAELECGECHCRGYCTEKCQDRDWPSHATTCRLISARRRDEKRHRRNTRKEKRRKKLEKSGYTPRVDLCSCGKTADFECSECGMQGYCSRDCQINDWEAHKFFCQIPQSPDPHVPAMIDTPLPKISEC